MYGPPLHCKRKVRVAGLVCANVSGLFVSYCSRHLMECAAFASYLVTQSLRTYSGLQVSRAPGSTVSPSHYWPANLAGNHNSVSSRRRWSAIVGIADAISKPGAFCQASIASQFFTRQQRRPIGFAFCQHGPCHASQLVGQGNGRDIAMSPRRELSQPGA